MKNSSKILASALLAATGLIGIQTQAMADDDRSNSRWGHSEYQQDLRALRESIRLAGQIDERLDNQLDRILAGLRAGRLTQNEFFTLMQEQRSIHQQQRRFLADGALGPREFDSLNQALNQADEHIRHENHDRQNASNGYPERRPYGGPTPWSR
jgi:hypothetical protein